MQFSPDVARANRSIGGTRKSDAKFAPGTEVSHEISVPTPFAAGTIELTEGMAAVLNQTLAENLSNNLRGKILAGKTEGEGESATTRDYTTEEVQALADDYLAEYEFGVRRTGSGEPRVTDPVEKEARALAREKAKQFVAGKGLKAADVDMPSISAAIFDKYRDEFMKAGKKIVDQRNKAQSGDGFDFGDIEVAPKAADEQPAG